MSETVIDSLVVTLGLDPRNFTKGQREALDSFKKTDDQFQKRLKGLEASGKSAGASFSTITNAAEGLFSVLAGASMARFARDTMNSVAATGRMATNIGETTKELSAFGRMIERNGGNAEAAIGSMKGFTDQITRLNTFGEGSQDLFKFLGIIGAKEGAGALETFMQFAEWAEKNKGNPQLVNIIGQAGGLDQGSINEALKGARQVREDLAKASVGALTKPQSDAMARMQASWVSLDQAISMVGTDLVGFVEPAFSSFSDKATHWIENNRKIADTIGGITAAIVALGSTKLVGLALTRMGLGAVVAGTAVATPVAVAAGLAYANLPTELGAEPKIYENGQLTEYGRRIIEADRALAGRGGRAAATSPSTGSGAFTSRAEKIAFVREAAAMLGIDPGIALKVAKGEGLDHYAGDRDATGKPTSFGTFQLHYPGVGKNTADGLGTLFTKQTGLDARDPATEHEQIVWAMRWVRDHGWGDFHGAANNGVGKFDGIGSTEVHIGSVNITAQTSDAKGLARDFTDEVKARIKSSTSLATQANTGLN